MKNSNELLNRALDIITSLECYASEDLAQEIEGLFQEVKYSDELDQEMGVCADLEAQDYNTFKQNKI